MMSSEHFKGIHKSLAYVLAVSQLSVLSLLPACAADNQVRIAGNTVFAVNGTNVSDRAIKIQQNIDNSLVASTDHGPSAVKITYIKGLPVITLGGFYVATVDNATAKSAATSPAILAQKWASSMKSALSNKQSVDAYVSQLTGASSSDSNSVADSSPSLTNTAPNYQQATRSASSAVYDSSAPTQYKPVSQSDYQQAYQGTYQAQTPSYQPPPNQPPSYGQPYQGRVSYIPAGMMIPVKLQTSISSSVAKAGDMVVATTTEEISLGNGVIPANTTLTGRISDSADGAWMGRSGRISIKFTSLRSPTGVEAPITAHISGNVGKYEDKGNSTFRGETGATKIKKAAVATGIGAGIGAGTGVAIGAIAGGGRGVGKGAWSGAAIGGGLGIAQSLLLRKGREVNMTQGQILNLQLDAPVTVAMN